MIKTKEIKDFIKELKNVEMECCETCPLSKYSRDKNKRKYSILNNSYGYCSHWLREISGINVVGKGCARVLEETIKYFTKTLPESTEHKNKI